MKQSFAAGKTLAQLEAEGLPEKWKSIGGDSAGTTRWIEAVYRGAAKM